MSTVQPPPQQFGPLNQPIPPRRSKPSKLPWILTGLATVLWLGSCSAFLAKGDPTSAGPIVTVTEEVPGPESTVTVTAAPRQEKAEPKNEPKAEPESQLGEGTYEVGRDIPAGRYKTTVPEDSSGCYWERAKDDSGSLDSIIANDNASPGARVSVTIKRNEFFKNSGCGNWARQ